MTKSRNNQERNRRRKARRNRTPDGTELGAPLGRVWWNMCKYPGCTRKSYTYKYCGKHRLSRSLNSCLAQFAKEGEVERVRRGVYQLSPQAKAQQALRAGIDAATKEAIADMMARYVD